MRNASQDTRLQPVRRFLAASGGTGAHRARTILISAVASIVSWGTPVPAAAQMATHAASGEFKPPTPSARHRQDPGRDNLAHPEGYVTASPGSLGQVVVRGDGEIPVLLVAGLGFGGRVFDPVVEALGDDYRFYVVSLAGYGGSSAPPMPPSGTSFGERTWLAGAQSGLASLIEQEGLDRPIVAAFYSDAANAATHLAAERPDLVGGLLIMSAAARFPIPGATAPRAESLDAFADQWFRTVTEIMWPSGMFPPEFYATEVDIAEQAWWDVLEPSLPVSIRYTVEAWADDLVPVLAGLEVPTVVLSPGFDTEFLEGMNGTMVTGRFHDGWTEAVEAGSDLRHIIVEGARFLIWEDDPESVASALAGLAVER